MKLLATAAILSLLACAPAMAQNYGSNQGYGNQQGGGGGSNRCAHHRRHHRHRNMQSMMNGGQFNGGQGRRFN